MGEALTPIPGKRQTGEASISKLGKMRREEHSGTHPASKKGVFLGGCLVSSRCIRVNILLFLGGGVKH